MNAGRVVIVGASVGGSRVASGLRQAGHTGPIALVDPDPDAPYDRPPLSKQILTGEWTPDRASLGDPAQWRAERHVAAAAGLDPVHRTLRLDSGLELPYDKLVLACGAVPRALPGTPRRGVHPLRTLADSLALKACLDSLAPAGHLVVAGGGFVGAEVASAARSRGIDVTIVEALPAPLSGLLGEEVAAELAQLHTDNGVRLLCGTSVVAVTGSPGVTGVELSDGTALRADAVVAGIGVRPATGWLEGSGLPLDGDGGVLCDEFCAVDAARTVYAVGDVARCHDPRLGRPVRVEHWTNAVEQAAVAVHNILEPLPVSHRHEFFVWSDQYGGKIALLGRPEPGTEVTVVRAGGPRRRFAVAYHRGPLLCAALTVNWPKALLAARRSLGTPDGAETAVAAWKSL
ncbi:NAD(P)/FAD-dependent oxidoreductase [Streptomyces argenteolus]|uniref:NAD(P)/FAD-dependent oxidoreductase n=1 Tax=Streptomyces argenteolus TaxID=67274 RepID=A0ABW6XET0_9ACTN